MRTLGQEAPAGKYEKRCKYAARMSQQQRRVVGLGSFPEARTAPSPANLLGKSRTPARQPSPLLQKRAKILEIKQVGSQAGP